MGKLTLKSVLFFTYFISSVSTESNKLEKESIHRLLSDEIVAILVWAVTSARCIFLLVVIIIFTNVIFVHNNTYQQHNYKDQNGFGIGNMGFVYYRQFSLICLLDTISKLLSNIYPYAIKFGFLFCIWYSVLHVANLLVSEYRWNLPVLLGRCNTGGLINLCFISSNAIFHSFPHMNCLPFLGKSYIGSLSFFNCSHNILRRFTIPAKLLQPLTVVGGCNLCIASNLLLNGLTQTLLSLYQYCVAQIL